VSAPREPEPLRQAGAIREVSGMMEVVPFLIPVAVFLALGITAQVATLREAERLKGKNRSEK